VTATGPAGQEPVLTTLSVGGAAVQLRRATADDVAGLVELLADDVLGASREAPDPSGEGLAPYLRAFELIDADPAHLLVVARKGPALVGTLQLSVLPGLARRGALRAQLESVHVARELRGRGLGRR
jgi:hypothetical protein